MSGCRVVVVEDEALIRLDTIEMLTDAGYDVVGQAADGEAGVRLVRDLHPGLVLMDVKMPGPRRPYRGRAAGPGQARPGRAAHCLLPVRHRRSCAGGRCPGFVVKPFTAADLLPALEIARARFAELTGLRTDLAEASPIGSPPARS